MTKEEASIIIGNLIIIPDDCYSTAEYQEAKAAAIQALLQEPCGDAISREAVSKILNRYEHTKCDVDECFFYDASEDIRNLPSVEPQPKPGHWIKIVVNGQHKIRCDKCDYIEPEYVTYIRNFCPNCGAKMESEEEE